MNANFKCNFVEWFWDLTEKLTGVKSHENTYCAYHHLVASKTVASRRLWEKDYYVRMQILTVWVLTNFTIVSHILQACWKNNSSNERSMLFFNTTLLWFDKFFSNHVQISNNSENSSKVPLWILTLTSCPEGPDIRWRFCLLLMMVWMAEKKSSLRTTISPFSLLSLPPPPLFWQEFWSILRIWSHSLSL